MKITIELPDELVESLETEWADVPRRILELAAVEGRRCEELGSHEVAWMLGFTSAMEADEFVAAACKATDALTEEERRRKYEKAEAMLERVRVRPVRKPGWEPLL